MSDFVGEVNDFLVDTFRTILKIEENVIRTVENRDLSISELHLIEAVGKKEKRTISEIASSLDITLPSVTIAINKLSKKGYVKKVRSDIDGRSVFVMLTELGKKTNENHTHFHQKLVESLADNFSEEEKENILNMVKKLDVFFKNFLDNKC